MYQAAIVEDNDEIRDYIKNTLAQSFNDSNVPVAFDTFSSGDRFLSMYEDHYHYDVIFLDIEMPGINGIDLCRKIRQMTPEALVIFISNKEELVFQTFEVQPFRFIRKSAYKESLPRLTAAIIEKWNAVSNDMIYIEEAGSKSLFSFSVSQIMYIEAQRKLCRIVTTTGETSIQMKLMDAEEMLKDRKFIKIHRSYVVNSKYIAGIGRTSVILRNKEELPVSRGKSEEIKQLYLMYTTDF